MGKKKVVDHKKIAAKVSRSVRLASIRLMSSQVFGNPPPDQDLPSHASQKVDIKVADSKKEGFVVLADLGISFGYEKDHQYSDEVAESPILVNAKFLLNYAIEGEDLTQQDLDAFASRTATYNVWPYWREFVQTMTTRMGLPPITIPLLNLSMIFDGEDGDTQPKRTKKRAKSPK